jgi:hypothetical protein
VPCRLIGRDFGRGLATLAQSAAATDADVIAFCGVRFMAETAKILSPQKIVVLPDMDAGCSLEDSCPPAQFKAFREAHPDHIALSYINCSAEVKALSDIIVTSSSAEICGPMCGWPTPWCHARTSCCGSTGAGGWRSTTARSTGCSSTAAGCRRSISPTAPR